MVDRYVAYMLILGLMTLTWVQGHSVVGWKRQKFSVQLFRQQSKQQALNLLQREAIFYVTLTLQTFIWLDHLFWLFFWQGG